MNIIKRIGRINQFNPNKILQRAKDACKEYSIDDDIISRIVIDTQSYLFDGITSKQIDEFLAKTMQSHNIEEPDLDFAAGYILLTSLKKDVSEINYLDNPILQPDFIEKYNRFKRPDDLPLKMSYFAVITFINEFSLKFNKMPSETPQDLWWRVSVALSDDEDQAYLYYNELSAKKMTTANPILVNSGTNAGKLISCTTLYLEDDSLEGINATTHSSAIHSSNNSGLGIYVGNVRSKYSTRSKGGNASGLRRLVKLIIPFSDFYQQHETRRGAFALYCDMWHLDIEDFIPLKRPDFSHTITEKNGFYGVCIPDLFYKRLIEEKDWSLFCPNEVRKHYGFDLADFHGLEFEEKYEQIEKDNVIFIKTVKTTDLMKLLVENQAASGVPYVFNRDNANRNHQQSYLGTCKSYQLCIEFAGISNNDYEAQCCLGSLNLPAHVIDGKFSYDSLKTSVKTLTTLLNRVIDVNVFNTAKAERAGKEHRNIGIGILGLADVFAMLDCEYGDEKSKELNLNIQKIIYLSALEQSNLIAQQNPEKASKRTLLVTSPEKFDFIPNQLKENIQKYGVANELLCCNMPTSTTGKLLDSTQSFEVFDFPINVRKTISGEFKLVNRHLVKDLKAEGKWNENNINDLLKYNNVKKLDCSTHIKNKYIDKYEHNNKVYLDMAADRQRFIDQGQSMNLYYDSNEASKISTALYYGWKLGLPSGSYYTTMKNSLQGTTDVVQKIFQKPANSPFECFGCD